MSDPGAALIQHRFSPENMQDASPDIAVCRLKQSRAAGNTFVRKPKAGNFVSTKITWVCVGDRYFHHSNHPYDCTSAAQNNKMASTAVTPSAIVTGFYVLGPNIATQGKAGKLFSIFCLEMSPNPRSSSPNPCECED